MQNLQNQLRSTTEEKEKLEKLFNAMQTGTDHAAAELLARLKMGDTIDDLLSYIGESQPSASGCVFCCPRTFSRSRSVLACDTITGRADKKQTAPGTVACRTTASIRVSTTLALNARWILDNTKRTQQPQPIANIYQPTRRIRRSQAFPVRPDIATPRRLSTFRRPSRLLPASVITQHAAAGPERCFRHCTVAGSGAHGKREPVLY